MDTRATVFLSTSPGTGNCWPAAAATGRPSSGPLRPGAKRRRSRTLTVTLSIRSPMENRMVLYTLRERRWRGTTRNRKDHVGTDHLRQERFRQIVLLGRQSFLGDVWNGQATSRY